LIYTGAAVFHHDFGYVFAVLKTKDARHALYALHQVGLPVYNVLEVFVDAVHLGIRFLLEGLSRPTAPCLFRLLVTALSHRLLDFRLWLFQADFLFHFLLHVNLFLLFLRHVIEHDLEDLELFDEGVRGVPYVDLLNHNLFLADFVGSKVDLALFGVD